VLIRLDVDGRYPQMTVSGTISGILVSRIHWIAQLSKTGPSRWSGAIWYKDGATASFPYTAVDVTATRSRFPSARSVKITFSGGGLPKRVMVYGFVSPYFRTVNLEFDFQSGEVADTAIDTCAHPVRPASLPCESPWYATTSRCEQLASGPRSVTPLLQATAARTAQGARTAAALFPLHESAAGAGAVRELPWRSRQAACRGQGATCHDLPT